MIAAIQRDHRQRGRRPARALARRRRRRGRPEYRADRARARLSRRCSSRAPPARSAPAAAQYSDIVTEFRRSLHVTDASRFDFDGVNAVARRLDARARRVRAELPSAGSPRRRRGATSSRRATPTRCGSSRSRSRRRDSRARRTSPRLVESFHDAHERVFAVREPGQQVECVHWKGRVTAEPREAGRGRRPRRTARAGRPRPAPARPSRSSARSTTAVYHGASLAPGDALAGPGDHRASRRRRSSSIPAGRAHRQRARRLPAGARRCLTAPPRETVDPALLAVLANRFEAIVREMTNTLFRTGRSAVINMARDFSCSIVTADDELLAAAEGLQVHVLGAGLQTRVDARAAPRPARGRRLPPQRPLSRQHAHRRPHDPRAGLRRGRAPVHRLRQGAPGRLRQRRPTTYCPCAARRLRGGRADFPCVQVQRDYRDIDDIIRMCRRRIRVPDQWYGDYLARSARPGSASAGSRSSSTATALETMRDVRRASGSTTPSAGWTQAIRKLPAERLHASRHARPDPGPARGVEVNVTIDVEPEEGRVDVRPARQPRLHPLRPERLRVLRARRLHRSRCSTA